MSRFSGSISLVLIATALMQVGCLSTLRVHRNAEGVKPESVKGLPFYTKSAFCKQQTIWYEPVYVLRLTVRSSDPQQTPRVSSKRLSSSAFTSPAVSKSLQSLRVLIRDGQILKAEEINQCWDNILNAPEQNGRPLPDSALTTSAEAFLLANTAEWESFVDYSRTYYLNSPRPWIGKSEVNAKVAPDGTLTDASASVESKTVATLTDLIPIKETLTALFGAAGPAATKGVSQPSRIYEVTTEETGYRHIRTTISKPSGPTCSPLRDGVLSDYSYRVEPLQTDHATKAEQASKTSRSIHPPDRQ